jgi:Alcohol dehydrogenase GroES-associated
MKALVYSGPKDVSVKEVSEAKIEKPTDVVGTVTGGRSQDPSRHVRCSLLESRRDRWRLFFVRMDSRQLA